MLRVLGYFEIIGTADFSLKKYNVSGIDAIALAEIDTTTKQMAMIPGTQGQVNEWINGKIPVAKKIINEALLDSRQIYFTIA